MAVAAQATGCEVVAALLGANRGRRGLGVVTWRLGLLRRLSLSVPRLAGEKRQLVSERTLRLRHLLGHVTVGS